MENSDKDNEISVISDSDNDKDDSMEDDKSDSASAKKWNLMFGENKDEDSGSTKTCDSEFTDEDIYISTEEEDGDESDRCCPCCAPAERDPVFLEEIISAMEWAESESLEIAETIYSKMELMLTNKTIVQIQMYGLGYLSHWGGGALQLCAALNLLNRFKENFPEITITSQEPCHVEEEINFLRSKGIQILETTEFSSEHFIQASISASNIQNPAFICYMIHGRHDMFNNFLEAHWKSELLSQCIFVGNDLRFYNEEHSEKLKEFAKVGNFVPLEFEDESVGESCYNHTCVYSISEENAKALIKKIS